MPLLAERGSRNESKNIENVGKYFLRKACTGAMGSSLVAPTATVARSRRRVVMILIPPMHLT